MDNTEIQKLIDITRIKVENVNEISNQLDSIITYVKDVEDIPSSKFSLNVNKNVCRDDKNVDFEYTDKIIENMPETENRFLKVKQIL